MAGRLIALVIGLPWVGALAVLAAGDRRPRAQHVLAVGAVPDRRNRAGTDERDGQGDGQEAAPPS